MRVGGDTTVHLRAAPGLALSDSDLKQVRHHAVLGHGLAVQAIRASAPKGAKVGFADNMRVAVPIIDTPDHVRAAEAATRERNAAFMTVLLEGKYTDAYLAEAGGRTPHFTDEELKIIATPLDFVGLNVYRPDGYVEPSDEARVYDTDRVMFMRAYLGQLQRATADGIPVDGYSHWSAQDNFEWIYGYGDRFGVVYVDFESLERIPKLSAEWFRQAARQNAVV